MCVRAGTRGSTQATHTNAASIVFGICWTGHVLKHFAVIDAEPRKLLKCNMLFAMCAVIGCRCICRILFTLVNGSRQSCASWQLELYARPVPPQAPQYASNPGCLKLRVSGFPNVEK